MPKKVIFNLLIIVSAIVAIYVGANFLGVEGERLVNWTVSTFLATWFAVFATAAATVGPVGTKSKLSLKSALAIVSVVLILIGLFTGGTFAVIGAVLGTGLTLLRFRGAL